ncbi:putative murein hydrolase (TIGR00659 family) [Parabacteroides sp. PFB2-12]|uniref:LrgB family protein n=1 Tax=unclassified Parabacteroides TaxID=2649774 RepID=UPI00247676D0|nr:MULTISPECIES: LrgB family protein [unclassified Parabacteroides]MDH6343996.1 putative murein hydrolase (TIGR00659 family) [Parabacteroides sp. PM6-13]MDH6391856.1 putative murein hydrolase (TIGR00659 family) [Parabacteroides sp. PFB2-12]
MNEQLIEKLKGLLSGEVFLLCLVFGTFLFGVYIYKRLRFSLLQPLLISVVIIIPFLKITGIEYSTFYEQTKVLNFMLGPSVVALGYVLYEQIEYIKGNVLSMLTAVFAGSIVGIASVVLIAKAFGADKALVASLAPKSVTTPIAISLAENAGGIPELAVAFVVICGIFGGLIGPILLRAIGIKSKIAKGLAIGSASHALGTTRAMEMGALEGAISGLAIGIMGIMTALIIPFVDRFFL